MKPLHICIFLRNFAAEYKEEKLWKRLENIRWAYKPSLRYEKKTMNYNKKTNTVNEI